MEFLDKLSDWFTAFTAWIEHLVTNLFGSSNERRIRQIGFARDKQGQVTVVPGSPLERINQLEPEMEKLSEGELRGTADRLRGKLADGKSLDEILPEAFAAVRESGRRYLKMRHYDVQMVGGYILHKGMIAEMVTGEGKTLVSTLPAFLNALAGKVHVVTVNDYLARRDMEWMGAVHMGLGLTVGAIQSQMNHSERQKHYACDITYGTNNEFGFDYLRDNMKPSREQQVQGPLDFAIVDEIDNILIDEARTPLIISGPAHDDISKYPKADQIVRQLEKGVDFEVKEKEHTCHLTEEGVRKAEQLAGVESFYTAGNMEWPHLLDNALKAHYLYKRDVNYVVEPNGEVVIVDEFTGRKMPGRQWSDGLHQAVEAKEGVKIKQESQTLATITLQNYFKLYKKLAGMTGTAMTEADEFWKIYKLDVISVPTNRPLHRVNEPDAIYLSEPDKWQAVVDNVRQVHETGRPILVGTVSIEKSELLSNKLKRYGIDHALLNAKYHEREAELVAQAGRKGAVTIATNMAGRGTDIILGGNPEHMAWEELKQTYASRLDVPKSEWDARTNAIAEREGMAAEGREVALLGGLHVIGTERHDSRRIDLQLRGRAGRQGDPGSSKFFLSLEDDLMRIFMGDWVKGMLSRLGMQEGEAIESAMVTRRIEAAQKKVEERHFDMRKHLLEYDEVMDEQRKRVYSYRQQILDGVNCRELILDMIAEQVDQGVRHFMNPMYRWDTIAAWAAQDVRVEVSARDVEGMDKDQAVEFLRDEAHRQAEDLIQEQLDENLPEDAEDPSEWNWGALSRWANSYYGLNTNDRELKKIGRDGLSDYLNRRAHEAIDRIDVTPLDYFLAEDWNRRSLCGWLNQQFTLQLDPEELEGKDVDETIALVRERIEDLYQQKEIDFPVAVGMSRYLMDRGVSDAQSRESLARWASERFETQVKLDEFKGRTANEIAAALRESSRRYYVGDDKLSLADQYLERIGGEDFEQRNGHAPQQSNGHGNGALRELADWAKTELRLAVETDDFSDLSREGVRRKLLDKFEARYRPELRQAERSLILDILDSAWKDHLYYMDHLRSGIGLVGYAQKDPKVEYKREGRKAFNTMWERVGQQVTSAIFRLEIESPVYVGSLWDITSVEHADAGNIYEDSGAGLEPGQTTQTIEPIRNTLPRVGRNDPCPCGSGKKYKKCCGVNG